MDGMDWSDITDIGSAVHGRDYTRPEEQYAIESVLASLERSRHVISRRYGFAVQWRRRGMKDRVKPWR